MRKRFFITLAALAERRAGLMLGLALVLTVVAGALAGRLDLKMQFKNMMPQQHPTVQEYDQIVDNYSAATNIIVAARGEEQALKHFADDLVPRLRAMKTYIRRVDYKLNRDFFGAHGFMLTKAKDLKNSNDQFSDLGIVPFLTHLNDSFEKTYVADSEGISNKEKEDNAVRALDGIQYWLGAMEQYLSEGAAVDAGTAAQAVDRFLIGDPYFISQDKDMLVIFAQPTFTVNEVDKTIRAVNAVDSLIARMRLQFPGIDAGTTGTMALVRDETVAASEDMYATSLMAFVLIIALFIFSFRMWTAPLLAGLSLIIGVIWAAGFAALTVGSLNLMTSMFGVVLIGLGIDFNIHVISVYTEYRGAGYSTIDALTLALSKSGNGVVVGAITTAMAFLTMLVSENAGMKEFGLVSGSGVLFCMLAALCVLPSLLVVHNRLTQRLRKKQIQPRSTRFAFLGQVAETLARRPVPVLAVALVVTVLLLYSALSITFNYNYLDLEPVGLKSIELQDQMIEEFDVTPDLVLVTTSSVEESRRITGAAKDLASVGLVTSISEYVPSPDQQARRLPYIRKIRSDLLNHQTAEALTTENFDRLIDELYRVEDNIIELAQLAFAGGQDKVDKKARRLVGDLTLEAGERRSTIVDLVDLLEADRAASIEHIHRFQEHYEPYLRRRALKMASEAPITLAAVPEDLLNQFVSYDGAHFLVSIFPKEQVWDFEFLGRFTEQMHRIDPRVTGLPLVFYVLIDYIGKDGTLAAMLTLIVVFLLLLFDFKSLKLALLTMVPLVVGAVWMVGLMHLLGMQFDIVNVIGIPLILGIGIDNGVHILHRFNIEGPGNLRTVFSSTGKAVLLSSLTTMLAFGSLGFAVYRGLASLGLTLFLGVGTALLATLLILPALLGLIKELPRSSKAALHATETRTEEVPC